MVIKLHEKDERKQDHVDPSELNCLKIFQLKVWGQWSTIDYKRNTTNEQRARSSKTWASVEEHDNARSTHTQGAHYCYLCYSRWWCFAYVCSSSALLEQLNEIETFQSRSLLSPYYRKVKKLQAFSKYSWLASKPLKFYLYGGVSLWFAQVSWKRRNTLISTCIIFVKIALVLCAYFNSL